MPCHITGDTSHCLLCIWAVRTQTHDSVQLLVYLLACLASNLLRLSQLSLTFVAGTTCIGCVFEAVLSTGLLQKYALVRDTVGLPLFVTQLVCLVMLAECAHFISKADVAALSLQELGCVSRRGQLYGMISPYHHSWFKTNGLVSLFSSDAVGADACGDAENVSVQRSV